MLDNQTINNILGIKENYECVAKLKTILNLKEKREEIFNKFLEVETDLSFDWFTNYFQEEHGDRNKLKQDYTPDCICEIINNLGSDSNELIDICAGTGGLTIKNWVKNPNKIFYCEEYSERAFVFLLLNMAIRGMNGFIINKDCLTGEIFAIYQLSNNGKYSDITLIEEEPKYTSCEIIMNPPYSMTWEADRFKEDERFVKYGLAPKSMADFAFVLDGLYKLKQGGTLSAILPHGVLFRGNSEEQIRKKLIENNLLDAVIGLPDKLFLNTAIPTAIIVLKKDRKNKDILFIDSSNNYITGKKQNVMNEEQINKIIGTYKQRKEVNKYSHIATFEEISKNNFNLNISRYVDIREEEKVEDLDKIIEDLVENNNEQKKLNEELLKMMKELTASTPEIERQLKEFIRKFEKLVNEQKNQVEEFYTEYPKLIDYIKTKSFKTLRLDEFATIERAIKGKTYKKGASLISMSATSGNIEYLAENREVDSKYAVIYAKNEKENDYLNFILTSSFYKYFNKIKQGMNFPYSELKNFEFYVFDTNTNEIISQFMKNQQELVNTEKRCTEALKRFKNTLLNYMFV